MQMSGTPDGTTNPTGTVTFLFTGVEGSTESWETHPRAMQIALARHEAIIRNAIQDNGGYAYKLVGNAFQAAFSTASQALEAAIYAQRALNSEQWPADIGDLAVCMALHTGVTEERGHDYVGPVLNRVARLLSAAHGGQVLVSHATQQLLRDNLPSGVILRDLGEHRLRDLIQPERIFQAVAEGLRADFPPLKTQAHQASGDLPHNKLPPQATPFVGREEEVEAVAALLRAPDVTLITLTGPGGIGKTRLALQVAAEALDDQDPATGSGQLFKDGVWFVDLVTLTDPNLVVPTIAYTLGLREAGAQPISNTLREYLRDRHVLLVLDNFEQVLKAAPEVGALLSSSPHLKMLVTGRAALRLSMEREHPVPPLPTPDPMALPSVELLFGYDAVRLFVQRAQSVKPGFEVDARSAQILAEICYKLEGIPLAIELAAARIRALPLEMLRSRLDSRLKLLTGGPRDLHARQQTLRSTIDWSYDLLTDGEKQFFRRLSVFRGGCTLEAAETVFGMPNVELQDTASIPHSTFHIPHLEDVLDGIASLVDKNLIYTVERASGELRYRMLEAIQEYASEKLAESGEREILRAEHALYFMSLAEEAEPHLAGPQQAAWVARLEDEHVNIRAALQWAEEDGGPESQAGSGESGLPAGVDEDRVVIGLRISGAIWRFWYIRGYFSEGREHVARLVERAKARPGQVHRPPDTFMAKALNGAGELSFSQGDHDAARSRFEQALVIARQLEDKRSISSALTGLANISFRRGDHNLARSQIEESLAIARQLDDKWAISSALITFGNMAHRQGDVESARSMDEESLALRREIGDKRAIASTLNNIAVIAQDMGEYEAARLMHEEALALTRELGDKRGIAYALNNLGYIALELGDYKSVRTLHEESLALLREAGDKWAMAVALGNLGMAAQEEGDYDSARSLFEESLTLRRELGDKSGISWSLSYVGLVTFLQGDYDAARSLYEESLALAQEVDDKRNIAIALANMGNLAAAEGDFDPARSYYEQSLALRREMGDKRGVVLSLIGLGSVIVESAASMGAAGRSEAARGTRVLGAVEALLESTGAGLDIDDRLPYERGLAAAHAQLSEAAFELAWQEGRAMSMDQAMEAALEGAVGGEAPGEQNGAD